MNLSLKDKNALVCGSSQGIGYATAKELALLGANVTLLARNEDVLKKVKLEIDAINPNGKHSFLCADFSKPSEVQSVVSSYLQNNDPITILINNTGGPAGGLAIEAKEEDFLKAFSMHLLCNQLLTQTLAPLMKQEGFGRIINIISTSVKMPIKGLGVSNTIRGAVASWAKTLSFELAPYGITVNNILPGATQTARLDAIIESKAKKTDKAIKDIAESMKAVIPAGRFAQADEIAAAVCFLATPAAAYINGVNLPVDGGRTGCL